MGSTRIEEWTGIRYPDFVGAGTGDQKAIQEAICSVKKASFDGVDCVGGDPTATGKVRDLLTPIEDLWRGFLYLDKPSTHIGSTASSPRAALLWMSYRLP